MATRREMLKCAAVMAGAAACGMIHAADQKKIAHPGKYWHAFGDDIQCDLCPNNCILPEGKIGVCRSRQNRSNALFTLGYGYPCAINLDPIEKKPLYHFLPGSSAYSIAVAGCPLRCKNCQNYTISQVSPLETDVPYRSPQNVVDDAKKKGARSIAYTFSEPVVWFEYLYDVAVLARKSGLKNVMVTSGYINPAPLCDLSPYLDGMHIDLKSFDEGIYRNLSSGKLKPVLDTILLAKEKGIWVEIVNLVVPQWTDNMDMIRRMCVWIRDHAGADTPLHFSRFFPLYKLDQLYPTPEKTLKSARKIAVEERLRYVYIGNVPDADSGTYCPKCAAPLVERKGYVVTVKGLRGSKCGKCGTVIPGVWEG
jgi:pyruvate formate lyase activating enzyme